MSNFTYDWKLADLESVKKNNLNVFSCFACGGGSTMGYKMSGFNVIGCNEIDPEMMKTYKKNHNPRLPFLESIETFKLRKDLPKELYNLDILDGSPPCSSFSMAGAREKKWGVKKKFREGQANQILDDLFFHYIDLAKKLQPKVVVAENVKGMLMGNAKGYVKQIIGLFGAAGYDVQLFLLNGATMGLPQKRERVFFVCRRKDLNLPKLKIGFNEKPISVETAISDCLEEYGKEITPATKKHWEACSPGRSLSTVHPKKHMFSWYKISKNMVFPTIVSGSVDMYIRWDKPNVFTTKQLARFSSFPSDYISKNERIYRYQMGMSVPPLMTHKLSEQIYKQWFEGK